MQDRACSPSATQTMGMPTADDVVVRGYSLTQDLLGRIGFADFVFLACTARLPTIQESEVFNAVLVSLAEYGLSASALATRMTLRGAPGAVQGAMAAGILGVGEQFVGAVDQTARTLQLLMAESPDPSTVRDAAIDEIITHSIASSEPVHGLGHPNYKAKDPRASALFELAERTRMSTPHVALLHRLKSRFEAMTGKRLPINVDGAVGALLSDLGLPWAGCRSIAVLARAGGLAGHIFDEQRQPIGGSVLHAIPGIIQYSDPASE